MNTKQKPEKPTNKSQEMNANLDEPHNAADDVMPLSGEDFEKGRDPVSKDWIEHRMTVMGEREWQWFNDSLNEPPKFLPALAALRTLARQMNIIDEI